MAQGAGDRLMKPKSPAGDTARASERHLAGDKPKSIKTVEITQGRAIIRATPAMRVRLAVLLWGGWLQGGVRP